VVGQCCAVYAAHCPAVYSRMEEWRCLMEVLHVLYPSKEGEERGEEKAVQQK